MKPDLVVIFVCILASGVHADAAVLAPNRAIYTRNLKSSDPECSMHVATGFWYQHGGIFSIMKLAQKNTGFDCARKCLQDDSCWAFSYNSVTRLCYLHGFKIPSTSIKTTEFKRWWSGYKRCGQPENLRLLTAPAPVLGCDTSKLMLTDNYKYDGSNATVELGYNVNTIFTCASLCSNVADCLFFNYDKTEKKCYSLINVTSVPAQEADGAWGLGQRKNCTSCLDGYYADGPGCSKCSSAGCSTCTSASTCTACVDGYYFSGASCLPCPGECSLCTSLSSCSACIDGYYQYGGSCLQCSVAIEGCSKCPSLSTCTACARGYYLDGAMCSRCSSSMLACSECTSSSTCTACDPGYRLQSGTCVSQQ